MEPRTPILDPSIFESLQRRVDEDAIVRDNIRDITQTLERHEKAASAVLSRAHSTPPDQVASLVADAELAIQDEIATVSTLAATANQHPYYKWNGMWTKHIQDVLSTILMCGWLGGYPAISSSTSTEPKKTPTTGRLLTIADLGVILNLPIQLHDRDAFHLTTEDYLHATINLVDELARLARNCVTFGDYTRPVLIARFVKDLHAAFQVLNLKNDSLRRRTDGLKYRIREVEDVVYDLSLRNLLPSQT